MAKHLPRTQQTVNVNQRDRLRNLERKAGSGARPATEQLPGIISGPDGEKFELRFNGGGDVAVDTESDTGDGSARLYASDTDSFVSIATASHAALLECLQGTITYLLVQAGAHYINAIADDASNQTYIVITESAADPAAADSNTFRFFARDNGAGKTQACIRFPSGAVQVLATEP